MFSLVPCSTLLNTVPTHLAPDETPRVSTQHAVTVSTRKPTTNLRGSPFFRGQETIFIGREKYVTDEICFYVQKSVL